MMKRNRPEIIPSHRFSTATADDDDDDDDNTNNKGNLAIDHGDSNDPRYFTTKRIDRFRTETFSTFRFCGLSRNGTNWKPLVLWVVRLLGLFWAVRWGIAKDGSFLYQEEMRIEASFHQSNTVVEEHQHRANTTTTTTIPSSGTSERYRVKEKKHWMPKNATESMRLERTIRDYAQPDAAWYAACAQDNGMSWIQNLKRGGNAAYRYYDRGCNGTGQHPQGIHWNPFETGHHNCSVTSQLELTIHKDHMFESWRLDAYDSETTHKSLGGDIFYVYYSEEQVFGDSVWSLPMAVGIPRDFYNGTYELDFFSVPFLTPTVSENRKGTLTVHPISTCFSGELHQPLKDGWKTGGYSNTKWTLSGIDRPYKIEDWWYSPRFVHPQYQANLNDFDRVVFFGDSIIQHTIWNVYDHEFHPLIAEKIQNKTVWVANSTSEPIKSDLPLSTETLHAYIGVLESTVGEGLIESTRTALVVGSAAWDIVWPAQWQGPTFESHLKGIEDFFAYLLKKYPHLTIVWKLPYSNHIQVADPVSCFADPAIAPDHGACTTILKYASFERFRYVYHAQKQFLEKTYSTNPRVQSLDFFDVSYLSGVHWMIPHDSIHFLPQWNIHILNLMFR